MKKLKVVRTLEDLTESLQRLINESLSTATCSFVKEEAGLLLQEMEQEVANANEQINTYRRNNGKKKTDLSRSS